MNTRFAPSIDNGYLHVGHAINMFANYLVAKQTGGQFFIIADSWLIHSPLFMYNQFEPNGGLNRYTYFVPNVHTLLFYFKYVLDPRTWSGDVVNTHMARGLVRQIAIKYNYNPDIIKILDKNLSKDGRPALIACIDHMLDIDVFIRGRDFQEEGPNSEFAELHKQVYKQLTGKEPIYYYTPLLLFNNHKMSKSNGVYPALTEIFPSQDVNSQHMKGPLNSFVSELGLYAYIVSLFEGRDIMDREFLANYWRIFDLQKICQLPNFEYDQSQLDRVGNYYRATSLHKLEFYA